MSAEFPTRVKSFQESSARLLIRVKQASYYFYFLAELFPRYR